MQTSTIILRIPAGGTVEHDRRRYSVVERTLAYTEIAIEKRERAKRLCQQANLDNGKTKG